jgi:1-acyl-sn-glycerol-3-phosphate acyltransferase
MQSSADYLVYRIIRHFVQVVFFWTMRVKRRGLERGKTESGYILLCAHVSHLDPFCISAVWPRQIGWMARIEFFRRAWSAWALRCMHSFPVNRQGSALGAIRESLRRLARDEVVGVFPEGELAPGPASVLRGGPIKRGACLLAAMSGRPVLPCIVVGTEKLNTVGPWLPFWRGRLWVICGDFIPPVTGPDRRAARAEMAAQIERAYVQLFAEMRERWQLPDSIAP